MIDGEQLAIVDDGDLVGLAGNSGHLALLVKWAFAVVVALQRALVI